MSAKRFLALVFLAASACAMNDRPSGQSVGDGSSPAPVVRTRVVTSCGHEFPMDTFLRHVGADNTCPMCERVLSCQELSSFVEEPSTVGQHWHEIRKTLALCFVMYLGLYLMGVRIMGARI